MKRLIQLMQNTGKVSSKLRICMILMILTVYVSACSDSNGGDPENAVQDPANISTDSVTITFALPRSDIKRYEPLAASFHEQYPSIVVQFVNTDDLGRGSANSEQSYLDSLASSADTSLIAGPFSGETGAYFRDLQALLDADPNFTQEDFFPGVLETCQDPDGNNYGIPFHINVDVVFFDKQAFDEAGLPYPQPGWTYGDFREYVTILAQGEGHPFQYGYMDRNTLFDSILAPLVNASLAEKNGEVDANLLQEDLQWYFDLVNEQAIYPLGMVRNNGSDPAKDEWNALFTSGNRPVMWTGNLAEQMPGGNSSQPEENPFPGMAIATEGLAPFPISEDGTISGTTPVRAQCLAISSGSNKVQAAWTWISFLSANQDFVSNGRTEAASLAQVPARKSVAEATGYWEQLPEGVEPVLRYAVEHAWTGGFYPQSFNAVEKALSIALLEGTDFTSAFFEARAEFEDLPPSTPDSIAVATPRPTRDVFSEVTDIRFFSSISSLEEDQAIRASVEAFNQEHPDINVQLSTDLDLPSDGVEDLRAYLDENYDCYNSAASGWSQKPENLLSLNTLIQAEEEAFLQDYLPEQLAIYYFEGELYGLPAASQPRLMSYNKDLLAKRGLMPPSAEWTFDDFIQLASAAASRSESDPSYGFLYTPWEDFLFDGRGIEWADWTTEPPQPLFNRQEVIKTLEWMSGLNEDGVLLNQNGENFEEVNRAMMSGQIAFWISQAGRDDMLSITTGGNPPYETGVVPMPRVEGGKSITQAVNRVFFISSRAKNPQACWTLIKYISEQPGVYPGVPARRSISESPAWEALVGEENAIVYRLALAREQTNESSIENSLISRPYHDWKREAILAALNGEDAVQTLIEAQSKADAYLACLAMDDGSRLNDPEYQDRVAACIEQVAPIGNMP